MASSLSIRWDLTRGTEGGVVNRPRCQTLERLVSLCKAISFVLLPPARSLASRRTHAASDGDACSTHAHSPLEAPSFPRILSRQFLPVKMATQAVSAVAGIAPQQAAPAQSAKASGFASGGVRVPRVAGLAKGSARVKHVTRASATPQVSIHTTLAPRDGAEVRRPSGTFRPTTITPGFWFIHDF